MSDHTRLRIKFQKTGPIRYIGHLDVMRFFQKCVRRAGIDISYTGGFSPHQIMSFAAPLGVGLESLGEYMDIEVNDRLEAEEVSTPEKKPPFRIHSEILVQRLNEASVPGIRIVSVKKLPEDAENAMASVAAAEYQVTFREGRVPLLFQGDADTIQSAVRDFLALLAIPYLKEGKKGTREIDLRPGIYRLSWEPEKSALFMLLDASSAGNIKPGQVVEALLDRHGQSLAENALKILRLETYTAVEPEGKGERKLIPMDEVGESF